ncbi:MAG: FliM/FliN family flagellar motor C-terminal domain-containing protein [Candidatus Korobacteraceae bacterium]
MSDKQLPADTSLVPLPPPPATDWRQVWWLPCKLSLELPLVQFTVRELLRLQAGNIVLTNWSRGAEVPLRANGQLIGWVEFEPVGDHIGVRITELV